MNDLGNFISTVGFPITVCCAFGYVLWQMWKRIDASNKEVTNTNQDLVKNIERGTANNTELMNTIKIVTATNKELAKTNTTLASKIEGKLDVVLEKLDQKER